MKKVSIKVFLSTTLALMLASMIPRTIDALGYIGEDLPHNARTFQTILFFIFAFSFLLFFFNYFMNRIIVKRVKELSKASKEVTRGNYDIQLEEKGKDEISEVIQNFNTMTIALKNNEYLNRDFIRNFSHEFKTPLSIIKGYSELIESSNSITDEEKMYLNIIISESNRLSNLSQNMMLISLVDNTTIIPINDKYNIAEQIRNIVQMMQLEWEDKDLELDLNLPNFEIISNKELVYQVLLNVIGNAIKFSHQGKTLQIELLENDNFLTVKVSNQGQVIPRDDFDKVFNLFYIADSSRSEKSTGIGLTLTKKIVDKLNGSITFDSIDGKTTFEITLSKN